MRALVRRRPHRLPDAEVTRLFGNELAEFGVEQMVWLALYEACRVGRAYGNAIIYS